MFNQATIIGFLGQNPSSRALANGTLVSSFSVATSRRFKDKDGNKRSESEWHNITCFGKLAETAANYLTKGKKVLVQGRIQTRSYPHRDHPDVKMYRTEIIANTFQMLDAREKGDEEMPTPPDDATIEVEGPDLGLNEDDQHF